MTPQDLIAAFDTLAEAPDGVTRLRELVLQLAVRGKLVPQDPEDEPATVLLERIAAEKTRLRKAGQIPKPKPVSPVKGDEVPFEVPVGWTWARLDALLQFVTSGSRGWARYYSNDGPVFLRIGNLDYGTTDLDLANIQCVRPPDGAEGSRTSVSAGDFLISITGDTGMVGLVPDSFGEGYINQHIALCRPLSEVWPAFVARTCTSLLVRDQLWGYQRGIKNSLGLDDIRVLLVPFPPLAEQKRIVARVDEVMGLLDRLEAARNGREATRAALRDAALAALRDADTPEEVEVAWGRVAEQMDDLFTDPADVDPLRQTVLQLAVRGRLVPQDRGDEPASVLLERIAAEKARLVNQGKIRRPKALPPVSEDEVPFDVPEGWTWSRCDTLFAVVTDGDHQPPPKADSGIPFLVIGNVSGGVIDFSDTRFVPADYYERLHWTRQPTDGDLLYTVTGSYGITLVVDTDTPFCVQRHIGILKTTDETDSHYLRVVMASPNALDYAAANATGTAQKTVSLTTLRSMPLPIPPLAEQKRIVAKVDELMGLLNRLEKHLADKTTAHDAFAAAAVHHMEA